MSKGRIYFDNAATTPLHPEAVDAMHFAAKEIFGNPSSIHAEGRAARSFIEESRKQIANLLHAGLGEIFFTSGGTESNNTILYQSVKYLGVKTIVSTPIEHPNVFQPIDDLHESGKIKRILLPVDKWGIIDLENLETILSMQQEKTLVSIMHVHNELGTIYPIDKIAALCKKYSCLFHCDTVQGIGFHEYDLEHLPIDFMSGSAHKFYGPKGIGFLYIRQGHVFPSLLKGGSQERNIRSGTENIVGIAGMTASASWCYKHFQERIRHLLQLKEYLYQQLKNNFTLIEFNTPVSDSDDPKNKDLSSTKILNVHFPFFEGAELLPVMLDIESIAVSGGSACSSGVEKGSHVIAQIRPGDMGKAIRFSFGYKNTIDECDQVVLALRKILKFKS